jgi:hypothetical protein
MKKPPVTAAVKSVILAPAKGTQRSEKPTASDGLTAIRTGCLLNATSPSGLRSAELSRLHDMDELLRHLTAVALIGLFYLMREEYRRLRHRR